MSGSTSTANAASKSQHSHTPGHHHHHHHHHHGHTPSSALASVQAAAAASHQVHQQQLLHQQQLQAQSQQQQAQQQAQAQQQVHQPPPQPQSHQPVAGPPQTSAPVQPPPVPSSSSLHRSRKEDNFLLSLPSSDREAWYWNGPSGFNGSSSSSGAAASIDRIYGAGRPTSSYTAASGKLDVGTGADLFADEDEDYSHSSKTPYLTNRGHKLSPGSKYIRKGRLGGWENHEIFESRSVFPSNNQHSLNGPGGGQGAGGSGGGRNSGTTTNHVQELQHSPGERGKLYVGPRGGSFPITPGLTLVPESSTAAARYDKQAGLGLPSAGSPGKKRRKHKHDVFASTSGNTSSSTSAPIRAYLPVPPQNPVELILSPLMNRTFSPGNRTLEKLSMSTIDLIEADIPLIKALTRLVDLLRGNSVAGLDGLIGLPFSADKDSVPQRSQEEQEGSENGEKSAEGPNGEANGHIADSKDGENGDKETVAAENGTAEDAATEAAGVSEGGDAPDAMKVDAEPIQNGDAPSRRKRRRSEDITEESAMTSGVRSRSRSSSTTSSPRNEEDEDGSGLETGGIPASIMRIAHPQAYIDSLFITPHDVTVPVIASSGLPTPPAPVQSTQQADGQAAPSNAEDASAAIPAGYTALTPAEQGETLRICINELTRFLADSLEYQDRLGEIRDAVLGVERRRKGVWAMAKSFAHQMLWEEEEEKAAMQQQQQGGVAGAAGL